MPLGKTDLIASKAKSERDFDKLKTLIEEDEESNKEGEPSDYQVQYRVLRRRYTFFSV